MGVRKRNNTQFSSLSDTMAQAENDENAAKQKIEKTKQKVSEEVEESTATAVEPVKKSRAKADSIAKLRPMQVSVHFAKGEKRLLNTIKDYLEDNGVMKPTVEDIVHNAVTEWVNAHKDEWPVEQFENVRAQDFSK